MLRGVLNDELLTPEQRREHLEYHARTCQDAWPPDPGICGPLDSQYIDLRIREGGARWFCFARGEYELGATGEAATEVRERVLSRVGGPELDVIEIVVLRVADDQTWAQLRRGEEQTDALNASEAVERVLGVGGDLRWLVHNQRTAQIYIELRKVRPKE